MHCRSLSCQSAQNLGRGKSWRVAPTESPTASRRYAMNSFVASAKTNRYAAGQ
jgi:hypothetical protein